MNLLLNLFNLFDLGYGAILLLNNYEMHLYEVQAKINESQKKALTEMVKLHAEMDELNSKSPDSQFDSRVWCVDHHMNFFITVCESSEAFIREILFHLKTVINVDKTKRTEKNEESFVTEYKLFTLQQFEIFVQTRQNLTELQTEYNAYGERTVEVFFVDESLSKNIKIKNHLYC